LAEREPTLVAYSLIYDQAWDDLGRAWPITNKFDQDGQETDDDVIVLICGPVDGKWWTVDLRDYREVPLN